MFQGRRNPALFVAINGRLVYNEYSKCLSGLNEL